MYRPKNPKLSPTLNRPLRIALLSPKGPLYRHRTGIFRGDLRAAPLTLTTLASLIPRDIPAQVTIFDEGVEDLPEKIEADIIGMTVITGSAVRAYELAKQYRSLGIPVVLGGPHVTLVPEDALPHADAIVTGYAEETWPQLLRDFIRGKLLPRYDMNPNFSFQALESIPYPQRHLLKKNRYKTINTFEATRGCIHHCEFCVVPHAWGTRPFQKPISHVIDDIRQSGARRILFYDLNLLADFKYAEALFQALVPLRIKWYGLSTVLIGKNAGLLELAAKSGCRGLLIGFESISRQVLAGFQKKFNRPEDYLELIRMLHSYGIVINGTFVFGNDQDTQSSFEEVQEFVIQSEIDLPRFSIVTPFPGTALFTRLDNEKRILHQDWSKYDGQHVVFEPRHMSPNELQNGHERVWREVYRWRHIARRTKIRLENAGLVAMANLAYRYYARNLDRFYNCPGTLV